MAMPRPTIPPPSLRYLERKRAEHRGVEAPKQEEMQREYNASPAPIKQPVPLDTAAFLAEGDNASWYNDLLSNPRDCCYAFCYPCPVCCPMRNLLCSLGFNLCCGWKVCNDVTLRFPHAQIPCKGVPRYAAGRDGVRSCGAGRGLAREGAGKCPRVWGWAPPWGYP